jgi:putative flavoprotein involved in K+ transport
MQDVTDCREVIVVGGGQAGLALGYFLRQQERDFTILEAGDELAAAWPERWDSLKLFTPARYSALPGLPFRGDPDRYPTRDEVATYLADYARQFQLPVQLRERVRSLRRADGGYVLETDACTYEAEQVVVATGPFQVPRVPAIADQLDPSVVQLHSSEYRRRSDIPEGPVLVVGGGNSGFQIAEELASWHKVHLSIGSSRQTPLPQRLFGRDLFWYLEATGLIRKNLDSRIGQRLSGRDTLIGSTPRGIRRRGVEVRPRAVTVEGSTVTFSDGTKLDARSVIWATGFRSDYSWIDASVFDERGAIVHRRGVTASPGLYFLGLTWQYTRGAALLGWVKDDAEYLARRIDEFSATTPVFAVSESRTRQMSAAAEGGGR